MSSAVVIPSGFTRRSKISSNERRLGPCAYITLALQMEDDLLRGLFGARVCGVDHHVGIVWHLVGIRDAGERLDDPGPCFRIEPLPVALFTHLDRRTDVDQHEPA